MTNLIEYNGLQVARRYDNHPIGRVVGWIGPNLIVICGGSSSEFSPSSVILCPVTSMTTPMLVREFTDRKVADAIGRQMVGGHERLSAVVIELRVRNALD